MKYCFLDLETTGLNPVTDKILEVAWVVTDNEFNEVSPRRQFILEHGDDWQEVFNKLRNAPSVVRDMHTNSGLMTDLVAKPAMNPDDIAEALFQDIEDGKTHLAGFSVGFDRSFLQEHLSFGHLFSEDHGRPNFHHRLLDLSSIKMMYGSAGLELPEVVNSRPHRAMHDVIEALDTAHAFRFDMRERMADIIEGNI